jgi:hypothetical protein
LKRLFKNSCEEIGFQLASQNEVEIIWSICNSFPFHKIIFIVLAFSSFSHSQGIFQHLLQALNSFLQIHIFFQHSLHSFFSSTSTGSQSHSGSAK